MFTSESSCEETRLSEPSAEERTTRQLLLDEYRASLAVADQDQAAERDRLLAELARLT